MKKATVKKYILNSHPITGREVVHTLTFWANFTTAGGKRIQGQNYTTFRHIPEISIKQNLLKKQLDYQMLAQLGKRTGLPGKKGYFKLNDIEMFREASEILPIS